jgi:DNA invertase Pin-like site-specific DNA recombinase
MDALEQAGCVRIFADQASGAADHRAELERMLDHLRPGDVVVIWRLDRLARSLKNLIEIVHLLEQKQVGLRSLAESIDTTTPGGKLVFHIFGALSEFERSLIVERTKAGLRAARARGRRGGRPSVMTPEKVLVAKQMHSSHEHTLAAIAKTLGVSRATVYRTLRAG